MEEGSARSVKCGVRVLGSLLGEDHSRGPVWREVTQDSEKSYRDLILNPNFIHCLMHSMLVLEARAAMTK